jgi:hypothetical protein
MTLARLREFLAAKILESEGMVAKLVTALSRSPVHALENSGRAFEAAAMLNVATSTSRMIDAMEKEGASEDQCFAAVESTTLREALCFDRSTSRSTSITSNLMEDCMRAAWIEVYRAIENGR